MNFKKFKKSLVSIVLGSSLFLVNGGVICQQPKAWFTDEFFTNAKERYKDDQNIQLLLIVLEFLSKLSNQSTLETKPMQRTEKLVDDALKLSLYGPQKPYLKKVLIYLGKLELFQKKSDGLAKLRERLERVDRSYKPDNILQSSQTENSYKTMDKRTLYRVALLLEISTCPRRFTDTEQDKILESLGELFQTNNQAENSAIPNWMISVLSALLPTEERN